MGNWESISHSYTHPEICAEAQALTWPCGKVSREDLLHFQHDNGTRVKKAYPDVCTNKGAMSAQQAEESDVDYAMSPIWMAWAQNMHGHMKERCDSFVEMYTPAKLDPPLFMWFGEADDPNSITSRNLQMLLDLPSQEQARWLRSLRYDDTGGPKKMMEWIKDSKNGIKGEPVPAPGAPLSFEHVQHAGVLLSLEKTLGMQMSQVRTIVEYGPGTGSFARQFRDLGFTGQHVTYDIPVQLLAQKFWNQNRGIMSCKVPECFAKQDAANGMIWQTEGVEDLRSALMKLPPATTQQPGVFMATYSLSESPVRIRDRVLDVIAASPAISHVVIAFNSDMTDLEIKSKKYSSNFKQNLLAETSQADYFSEAIKKRGWGACGFELGRFGRGHSGGLLIATKDATPVKCVKAAGCDPENHPWPSCAGE